MGRLIVLLLLLTSAGRAGGEEVAGVLEAFLEDLESLSAEFVQLVGVEGEAATRESSGSLKILRPGRFRWDYVAPTAQLVISDGERLWLYDPDLEQVTVRELDESLSSTPAMLLGGEGDLAEHFRTGATYEEEGVRWVELAPLAEDSDFNGIRVGFCAGTICRMELKDKLGQYTQIRFSNVRLGETMSAEDFRFQPPPGVDVISESDF